LALLEPMPPGPELVDALTGVAVAQALAGRPEDGVRYTERALALGEELGLERSARALGYRGLARIGLGDPGGLEDMREAIALATEAGQGREVAVLHNNLGDSLWMFEGLMASLEVMRTGIAFAKARGLAEMVDFITTSTLGPLIDSGELDNALEVAAALAERIEGEDVMNLIGIRATKARILALRGQAAQAAGSLNWMESRSRGTRSAELSVIGLGSSALARLGIGQDDRAAVLLAEVEVTAGARETQYYAVFLPAMVRIALSLGDQELAERLVSGLEPRYPYAEHVLVAANASLTEAHGDLQAAVDAYADAATRWERFGVVPEQAFALLGQGRSLVALGRATEARPILARARGIFARLEAAPALAEVDALLKAPCVTPSTVVIADRA
jgi:tetratricopeptide (TPR) repeat protein